MGADMPVSTVVKWLKDQDEDFEWYPTTDEIIKASRDDAFELLDIRRSIGSVLDVGAGDGRVLNAFAPVNKYAIEKSLIHIRNYGDGIIPVGTDFNESTLIDKAVDVLFCNPPFSEYSGWASRIILEANARIVYLVLPVRWEENDPIAHAIKSRGAEATVLGEYTFEEADRKARAHVHLIRISLAMEEIYRGGGFFDSGEPIHTGKLNDVLRVDPFALWFRTNVEPAGGIPLEKEEEFTSTSPKIDYTPVKGMDLITRLVELYDEEIAHLIKNYQSLTHLDPSLIKELGVEVETLRSGMAKKIEGLKRLYWKELLDNMSSVTSRLTARSREGLIDRINANMSVDFTPSNAYAIVIWIIKNANKYYDSQLTEYFLELFTPDSVQYYKSTQKTYSQSGWRYTRNTSDRIKEAHRDDALRYTLEYRIVSSHYSSWAFNDHDGQASWPMKTFLNDTLTIAKNLGFSVKAREGVIFAGKKCFLYYNRDHVTNPIPAGRKTSLGKIDEVAIHKEDGFVQYLINGNWYHESYVDVPEDVLLEFKAYRKGTIHLKFDQSFIRKLNLKAAQILGWVTSPAEAHEEMGVDEEEAAKVFASSLHIPLDSSVKLLGKKGDA